MYEWVIIGGGIQGVTLAAFLIKTKKSRINLRSLTVIRNRWPIGREIQK